MDISFEVTAHIPNDAASNDTESDLRSSLQKEIRSHLQDFLWSRYEDEDIKSKKSAFKVEVGTPSRSI